MASSFALVKVDEADKWFAKHKDGEATVAVSWSGCHPFLLLHRRLLVNIPGRKRGNSGHITKPPNMKMQA